jgi:hypothetical protein
MFLDHLNVVPQTTKVVLFTYGVRHISCHGVLCEGRYSRRENCTDRATEQQLLNCTHEAEWIPFQIHCFSENMVTPGIESWLGIHISPLYM